jgi:hypothetical protein
MLAQEASMTVARTCLVLTLLLVACGEMPPPAPAAAASPPPVPNKAVLVAGDGTLPVFDNAVSEVEARLPPGSTLGSVQRLSAAEVGGPQNIQPATLANVLGAISSIRPGRSQGCFVYATSHGGRDAGLEMQLTDEFLTPQALDQALRQGCGNAPTAVVISGCYSGVFAKPPMTRPNRIVLTASRPDRTSFGCRTGRTFTVYDKCLLDAFDAGSSWRQVYAFTKACVGAEERREHVTPSEPQAWFGAGVATLALPVVRIRAGG